MDQKKIVTGLILIALTLATGYVVYKIYRYAIEYATTSVSESAAEDLNQHSF